MPKLQDHIIIEAFKERAFTSQELFDLYRDNGHNLKPSTFAWRVYDLKKRNIIRSVKRGSYILSAKPIYQPDVSTLVTEVSGFISSKFQEVKFCVWDTSWLSEFLQHQSSKLMHLVEIEKGFEETLYYELKDNTDYEVFLSPTEKEIKLYVLESKSPVVIKRLISRSPLSYQKVDDAEIPIPQLEKILVDLFADDKTFAYLQGAEMIHIYENALSKYSIDFTTLFSYAKRRDRHTEIKAFLLNHLAHLVKDVLND